MDTKLHFGIVSTASIVPRFVKGVKASANSEVVAIASRDLQKAQEYAKNLDIAKAYGSYEALFQDQDINIIYIATPHFAHVTYAKAALEAGKHVLCEKPITLTTSDAKELFALAKKKGLFLMEAQKSVFLPTTNYVKTLIQQKRLGNLRHVKLSCFYPYMENEKAWMLDPSKGGGSLYGSGSYAIEYMMYILDATVKSYKGELTYTTYEVDDISDLSFQIGEVDCRSIISRTTKYPDEARFTFDQGEVIVPYFWKAQEVIVSSNGKIENYDFASDSEFVYEVMHVESCINQGLTYSPIMTPEMSISTVEMVEQVYKENRK
ncbi:putative dehydrogenase [Breznakia blatticola]|uniref:Putative dehydrogenase n=1 Tax=Breznakia blatticola TaxID=1754012 RepID=A0A4R7ZB25_9FIRM|nr:Gfo/Idh/MocA family oxidoreductase [Breznakia blatticola]TDW14697.1 putative dehydrogenase [Breznakia blatticola]